MRPIGTREPSYCTRKPSTRKVHTFSCGCGYTTHLEEPLRPHTRFINISRLLVCPYDMVGSTWNQKRGQQHPATTSSKAFPPYPSLRTTSRSCLARSWSKLVQRTRSASDRYDRKLPFLLVLLSVSHHMASTRCNNTASAELLRGRHAQAAQGSPRTPFAASASAQAHGPHRRMQSQASQDLRRRRWCTQRRDGQYDGHRSFQGMRFLEVAS